MGLGNHLTLFMWAEGERARGRDAAVLITDKLRPWLDVFPALRTLAVERDRVGWRDARATPWLDSAASRARHGHAAPEGVFPREQLEAFVRRYVVTAPMFERSLSTEPGALTINVRRGDYFSDPDNEHEFAINIDGYLREAVPRAIATGGAPSRFLLVSDDVDWCLRELPWLNGIAPVRAVDPSDPPRRNFYDVATSRRMVITNSTFSYWAAYTSNVLFGDNHGKVTVPAFFSRSRGGERGWEVDPRWDIVEQIAGGWQPRQGA